MIKTRYFALGAGVLFLMCALGPTMLHAQEPEAAPDSGIGLKIGVEDKGDKKENKRSYRPKERDASYLKKAEPLPEVVEVQSRYEAFLQSELRKHYARLAVIDRVLELAEENDDDGLNSRADAIRRKELQRFRAAMNTFRQQAQARRVAGFE